MQHFLPCSFESCDTAAQPGRTYFLAVPLGWQAPLAICVSSSGAAFGQSFAYAADSTFVFSILRKILLGWFFCLFY